MPAQQQHCQTCTCYNVKRCTFTHIASEHHIPEGPEWDFQRQNNQALDGARCINVNCSGTPHTLRRQSAASKEEIE